MRKFISAIAALLIGAGMTSAQQTPLDAASPNMTQPNTSVSETTGQPPKFEDRWSAQGETLDRPPITTMSDANTPSTTGQVPKPPLDQGNGNWVPPPVTAPSTTSSGTTGQDPSVIDETNDPDGTKAAAKTCPLVVLSDQLIAQGSAASAGLLRGMKNRAGSSDGKQRLASAIGTGPLVQRA
jgi:hypothetical protein